MDTREFLSTRPSIVHRYTTGSGYRKKKPAGTVASGTKERHEVERRTTDLSRLYRPNASRIGFMLIVRWWSIRIWVNAHVHLRRGNRPCGWLVSIRVHVWVRNVPWDPLTVWHGVVSVPRPPESVCTLGSLSCPLCVGIREGTVLGEGAVRVNQMLVISGRVLTGIRGYLLHRGRVGWNGERVGGRVWTARGRVL